MLSVSPFGEGAWKATSVPSGETSAMCPLGASGCGGPLRRREFAHFSRGGGEQVADDHARRTAADALEDDSPRTAWKDVVRDAPLERQGLDVRAVLTERPPVREVVGCEQPTVLEEREPGNPLAPAADDAQPGGSVPSDRYRRDVADCWERGDGSPVTGDRRAVIVVEVVGQPRDRRAVARNAHQLMTRGRIDVLGFGIDDESVVRRPEHPFEELPSRDVDGGDISALGRHDSRRRVTGRRASRGRSRAPWRRRGA
jgi:hypothetical protein